MPAPEAICSQEFNLSNAEFALVSVDDQPVVLEALQQDPQVFKMLSPAPGSDEHVIEIQW